MTSNIKIGDLVFWTDPDESLASQEGIVSFIDYEEGVAEINNGNTGVLLTEITLCK